MPLKRICLMLGLLVAAAAGGAAQTPATPGGIKVAKDNGVTEANIVAYLAFGDSVELQLAQLAQAKATDPRVKDYATMLANDHRDHLGKVLHLMTGASHIGSQPMANDSDGGRSLVLLNSLTSMPAGTPWDAMFVRSQIRQHQSAIDALTAMRRQVRAVDLRDLVDATLLALTKHRDSGRSVAILIGVRW